MITPPANCDPQHFSQLDLDCDSDVDLRDVAEFQSVFERR